MRLIPSLGVALFIAAQAGGPLQAATYCGEPVTAPVPDGNLVMGRQFFAQGVSLLDAKKFGLAEKALQSALFTGLPPGQEQASAHKYLAYVYCLNDEPARCEAEFEAALSALPAFSLGAYELQGTPWRAAYVQARLRWSQRCGRALSEQPLSSDGARAVRGPGPVAAPTEIEVDVVKPAQAHRANTLQLRVSPWAQVRVDGKRLGVTPPVKQFKLAPGRHLVELSVPGFDSVRQTVRMNAGESVTITHDFDAR